MLEHFSVMFPNLAVFQVQLKCSFSSTRQCGGLKKITALAEWKLGKEGGGGFWYWHVHDSIGHRATIAAKKKKKWQRVHWKQMGWQWFCLFLLCFVVIFLSFVLTVNLNTQKWKKRKHATLTFWCSSYLRRLWGTPPISRKMEKKKRTRQGYTAEPRAQFSVDRSSSALPQVAFWEMRFCTWYLMRCSRTLRGITATPTPTVTHTEVTIMATTWMLGSGCSVASSRSCAWKSSSDTSKVSNSAVLSVTPAIFFLFSDLCDGVGRILWCCLQVDMVTLMDTATYTAWPRTQRVRERLKNRVTVKSGKGRKATVKAIKKKRSQLRKMTPQKVKHFSHRVKFVWTQKSAHFLWFSQTWRRTFCQQWT